MLTQNNIVRLKNKAYNANKIKKYFYRQISTKFDISLCFNIFHIFYMWEGGKFMRDYIINEDILCFTQDSIEKNNVLVIEKAKRLTFKGNSLKFLKKCCFCYGHSYNIQRQFVIDHFNYYIKTPIILSEYNKIILFPTASPESNKCIWLSYNNIERYVEAEKNYTEIYFKGGKVLKIRAPYTTIDNQITKCIKIEKLLNSLQYTEM